MLQLTSSIAYLSGDLELRFINNSATEGSALHLISFAQIILSKGLRLIFEGNEGRLVSIDKGTMKDSSYIYHWMLQHVYNFHCDRLGASIEATYTMKYRTPKLADNSLCPFVYEEDISPLEWTDVCVTYLYYILSTCYIIIL